MKVIILVLLVGRGVPSPSAKDAGDIVAAATEVAKGIKRDSPRPCDEKPYPSGHQSEFTGEEAKARAEQLVQFVKLAGQA